MTAALLVAGLASAEPKETCQQLKKNGKFTAFFDRVEIEKLVQTVSDATCKTFIIGENVRGKISIIGPESGPAVLTADEFYAAFLAALDANGFTAYSEGRFMRVVEKARARSSPIPLEEAPGSPNRVEVVTRVFRLHHAELEPTRALLSQFVSPGADAIAFPPDLLIVSDLPASLERFGRLLAMVDVERPAEDEVRVISVAHANASQVADQVQRVLAPRVPGKPAEPMTLVADERTNRLLLVAKPAAAARAAALIATLDIATANDSRVHVYKLANAEAKELLPNLEGLVGGRAGPPQPNGVANEVKITANESLNALVIVASTGDYRSLEATIRELDVPRRQVFIETVIMEINAERNTVFGVGAHVIADVAGAPIAFGSEPDGAPSSLSLKSLTGASGLVFGTAGPVVKSLSDILGIPVPQFGITLQAMQLSSDANVLSTPHILTTDNKEAEIIVGQRIPFQSGINSAQVAGLLQTGNPAAATTLSSLGSVTRERVELKLNVKPHIGEGDAIRLEINQQAEELAGQNSLGPITSTRAERTTVVARDAETIVLGGIMQDRLIESASKTPVLGDIPLLGHLFRWTSVKKMKVNLLVFLTPHIIREPADFQRVLQQKARERQRIAEQLYGQGFVSDVPIDFSRKPGPLAAAAHAIDRELAKPENGGRGAPGEALISPAPP